MALSVVYFRITHCLGRPHYMWDEYLYSVLEKVEVRVTVSVTVLCGMMMKGRKKVKTGAGSQPALLEKHQRMCYVIKHNIPLQEYFYFIQVLLQLTKYICIYLHLKIHQKSRIHCTQLITKTQLYIHLHTYIYNTKQITLTVEHYDICILFYNGGLIIFKI